MGDVARYSGRVCPKLRPPTLPSDHVLGTCCVCLRAVLLYQGRDDGFLRVNGETMLVHWECAEAVRIAKAETVQPVKAHITQGKEQ